jgi:penicillin V acylase-like amidase (Ntn superfamily)
MAQYEEITIDQGADASVELHLVNTDGSKKNLTNHTVTAKMKKNYTSDSSDTTEFVSTISNALDGIATISLTNIQTDALKAGRYVYDVELSFQDSDGDTIIERVLEGKITITPSVTR